MEDGTIRMSLKEHVRVQVCQEMLRGRMREKEGAGRLGLSVRQVRRLKKRVGREGPAGVIHRLRGRPSSRRTPQDVQRQIKELYQERYAGWNMAHFGERLADVHGIVLSRERVRGILLGDPSRPRRVKRRKHRRWRARRSREGDLVQMDASIHPWLGEDGEEAVLISAIDDATGKALWAGFFACDGTLENLAVVKGIVRKYGIPAGLYLDRSSKYFPEEEAALAARERGEEALTQFGRAMRQLGIEMVKARSPQAKGRVERSFRTFQDRLVKELELEGLKTISEADAYLRKVFVPAYNGRFAVRPEEKHSAFVKMSRGFDYNEVFCLKQPRTVQNDYTVSYEGEKIQLEEAGVRAGQKVEVRVRLDASVHVYRKGNRPVKAHKILKKAG
jgi:transposase